MRLISGQTVRDRKSVLIADEHPIVRRGVRALLETHQAFEVVGEVDQASTAVKLVQEVAPTIVVIDVSMPGLGGLETLRELRHRVPETEVVVFALRQSFQLCDEVMAAGAKGYVCKSESDHLIPALEAATLGRLYLSPAISQANEQHSTDEAWDRRPLSRREREVVRLVAEGHSNKEVARLLKISIKTTETHRASAMRKTGTKSIAALTLYAARNGLVAV